MNVKFDWRRACVNAAMTMGLTAISASTLADTSGADKSQPKTEPMSVLPLEDLRVFTKAFDHIRKGYVKDIDDRTLLEYAIRGMLDELDPHSSYLDASSFKDLQVNTTGEFGGLGIEVGMENGFVKVISPIDETPAARAGIEAGDLIVKLDGSTVKGLTLNDAVEKMRGPKGTKITVTVVREGVDQPFDLVLTRDIVKVRSVRTEIKDQHYAYLRIAQFQVHTGQDLAKEFAKLSKKNADLHGVILDLRNNPGGVLTASVEVADHFLEDGLIVYTEGRVPDSNSRYQATPGDITNGLPLVVLINDGSASASEIVAGALQDQGRALVLGTQSFGKGSVQSVIQITNDKALKLTTALYYTPNGRSIQAEGITPDIEVERVRVTAVKNASGISEAGLVGHLENGNGGHENQDGIVETEAQKELHNTDSQLYEAINILKGLHLFNQRNVQKVAAQEAQKTPAGQP
ncbi:Carboxy-terminal processing protease CtpB [Thalassocella blandensis]|nr:Carboxy-terminal processing protease CtpB [Thalassocella blandensis]